MQIVDPIRVERTYIQKIHAEPDRVFPLLCPVRETEWVEGWNPSVVLTRSGFAEPDCIFVTSDSGETAVWVITQRDPKDHLLEMIKVTPGMTVGKIRIKLEAGGDATPEAEVSYMYTALSAEGAEFVNGYTEEFFTAFMEYWERTLNDYLGGSNVSITRE
jgi:hypothetical protein